MSPIVVKFGGEVVQSSSQLGNLLESVKDLYQKNENIVLVHGGGPIATDLSKKLNIQPKMVGGRRVTCKDTLEVIKMVLPGIVNSNVLALLRKMGLPGVGASGISFIDAITRPKKAVSGSSGELVDWGFVGDVLDVNPEYLSYLLDKRYIPVVSPLSADKDGKILNINADTIAVQIAKKIKAKDLVLITSVGGVYKDIDDKESKFEKITVDEGKKYILEGIVKGGMIPKLEEGFKLLEEALEAFHIVGTDSPDSLLNEILNPGSIGTAVIKK